MSDDIDGTAQKEEEKGCANADADIKQLKKIPHTGDTNSLDRCG